MALIKPALARFRWRVLLLPAEPPSSKILVAITLAPDRTGHCGPPNWGPQEVRRRGAPVTFVRYEQAFDRYIAEKAYKDIGAAAVEQQRCNFCEKARCEQNRLITFCFGLPPVNEV